MEQTLGERMKEYEFVTRDYLTNRIPVIIRLDGKAFHTFTKGLKKPFDVIFVEAMKQTTLELAKQVQGTVLAYTQSDEVSLLLLNSSNKNSELWFNNNLSKIISVSASIATLEFNKAFMHLIMSDWADFNISYKDIEIYNNKVFKALFDSRAFNIPEEDIVNYFIWRQRDCQKNAVNATARTMFSHSQLNKLNQKQLKEKMLQEKNFDFDEICCDEFKNGITYIYKEIERIGVDNLGKQNIGTSKKFMQTNKLFEKDYNFFLEYFKSTKNKE